MSSRILYQKMVVIAIAVISAASLAGLNAQQPTGVAVRIGNEDIGGVVTSSKGPEAASG